MEKRRNINLGFIRSLLLLSWLHALNFWLIWGLNYAFCSSHWFPSWVHDDYSKPTFFLVKEQRYVSLGSWGLLTRSFVEGFSASTGSGLFSRLFRALHGWIRQCLFCHQMKLHFLSSMKGRWYNKVSQHIKHLFAERRYVWLLRN